MSIRFLKRVRQRLVPWTVEGQKVPNQSGMTLIEIIIVVALLGTLMAYLVTNLTQRADTAKIDQSKLAMSQVSQALDLYKVHVGKYPETLNDLMQDNTGGSKKWRGPYTEDNKLKDPWDNDFEYTKDGRAFKLTSKGPDGNPGTEDDITFPDNASQPHANN